MTTVPRVGLVGFQHEANAFAAPVGRSRVSDWRATPGGLDAVWEAGPATQHLRSMRPVETVDLPVFDLGACGTLDGEVFRELLAATRTAVTAALPLDAVIVVGHGAGRASDDLDPDGTFLTMLRHVVGEVPVVAVLDFHANVSPAMCAAVDVVVGYRTNPHVDIVDRLREAADHVDRLLDTPGTVRASCHLPLLLSQIAQLTTDGEPLGVVIAEAEALCVPPVRNISVFGGFSLGDVPDAGVSVCVTADAGRDDEAARLATDLATRIWDLRHHFRMRAPAIDEVLDEVAAAAAGRRPPAIVADTADNPGGGAPGNSTALLSALHDAGLTGVVAGLQCDPAVVDAAWHAGVGARLAVTFNRGSTDPLAAPWTVDATVLGVRDGDIRPTRGVYAGAVRHPGRTCTLGLGSTPPGMIVGVSEHPVQCADDDTLRHVGIDPSTARVVVVKSRGHFRAGFDHLFGVEQVVEVDAGGVTTSDLARLDWRHLPRPMFPLDPVDDDWRPDVQIHHGTTPGVGA